jgi:hypothetical protein
LRERWSFFSFSIVLFLDLPFLSMYLNNIAHRKGEEAKGIPLLAVYYFCTYLFVLCSMWCFWFGSDYLVGTYGIGGRWW